MPRNAPPSKIGRGRRIPESIRVAILGEPETASHSELARKYGVSDVSVRKIRLSAGVNSAGRNPASPTQPTALAVPKTKRSVVGTIEPAVEGEESTVSIRVTEPLLDSWWKHLPLSAKKDLFSSNLFIRVEGTIS